MLEQYLFVFWGGYGLYFRRMFRPWGYFRRVSVCSAVAGVVGWLELFVGI